MYSMDSFLHQVSQDLGEEAPPKSLACTSGGPVSHRSTRVAATRVGLGILHRTVEHSQILQRVAAGQEAEDSQIDPSSPLVPLTTAPQRKSAPQHRLLQTQQVGVWSSPAHGPSAQPMDASGLSTPALGQSPVASPEAGSPFQVTPSSAPPVCLIGPSSPSVPTGSSPVPHGSEAWARDMGAGKDSQL